MKYISFMLMIFFSFLAHAELYKYTSPEGKTIYSDQPPISGDAQRLPIANGGKAPIPAPAESKPAGKSLEEQELEFRKRRAKAEEEESKKQELAAREEQRKKNCNIAKSNLQSLQEGGRVYKYNNKGEKAYIDDKERPAEIANAKKEVESLCKS